MKVSFVVACSIVLAAGRAFAQVPGSIQPVDNFLEARRAAAQAARDRMDATTAGAAGVNAGLNHLNFGITAATSFIELRNAFRALNASDERFDPSARPPGTPDLPVSCASGACMACYEEAHDKLRRSLFTLGMLQTIYLRTKTFTDKAVAFGDSSSGIHAVSGLAWQNEKRKILEAMDGMNAAYDRKKPELMAPFKAALEAIAQCEQTHFNNPDWFQRFGFIYYSFIDQKYSR